MYDASKNHTKEAIQNIINTTARALSRDDWVKYKQLPAATQAHLLCEAYLATLRDRSLPGKKAAAPVNMLDEFIPPALREKALEAANKLHPLLEKKVEMPTPNTVRPETRGKYTRRIVLRDTLHAFYTGTGYVISLDPRLYGIDTVEELRNVATKIASNFTPGWYKTEMSPRRVTIRKLNKVQMAKKTPRKRAAPVVKATKAKRFELPGLRYDMEKFFGSSTYNSAIALDPRYYDAFISAHLFRDKVSTLACGMARGKYTTEIKNGHVVLTKKA